MGDATRKLVDEARAYARKERIAETRDGEQMHRTLAEILDECADALEAAQRPSVPGDYCEERRRTNE